MGGGSLKTNYQFSHDDEWFVFGVFSILWVVVPQDNVILWLVVS